MRKISFRVRNFENEQFLTFNIDNEAELDEELLDFVEDEEPAGIVPVIFEEGEEFDTFSYNITDKIHLSELSNQEINAEMVLRVLRGLVLTFIDMAEYRIPLSYLVLNRNYIYVDSEYKIEFICVPLEDMKEETDLISFLRNFMASLRFEPSENGDYVAKLFTYINNRAIFNLRNLLTMVEELLESMGIEIPEEDSAEIYAEYHEVEEEEPEAEFEEDGAEEAIEKEVAGEPETAFEEAAEEVLEEVFEEETVEKAAEEEVAEEPEAAFEEEGTEEAVEEEVAGEPEAAFEEGAAEEAIEEEVAGEPEAAFEEESAEEAVEEETEESEAAFEEGAAEEAVEEEAAEESEEFFEEEAIEEPEEVVEGEPKEALEEAIEEETQEDSEDDEITSESQEIVNKIKEKLSKNNKNKKAETDEFDASEGLENNIKGPKKPLFKTKETPVTGVVIPDELDEFLAEKEFEEQQTSHEETGLKIKKNIKINRASIVKNTQEELKAAEEASAETENEEDLVEDVLPEESGEGKEAAKTAPIPKVNPYLIRVNTEERIMITKQTFKIGKASMGVDYTVKGNGAISRVHAIITNKDDEYYIKDNKSTNHTFVNGKVIEEGESELLTHDCKIVLGDEEFIFKLQ